jgi:DNA primase
LKLQKTTKNQTPLTKENVLIRVEEEEVFQKYLKIKPTSGLFCNPLRIDKNPTCSFYVSDKNGRLMFHDFALGTSWDCFAVVMQLYGLNFWEALKKVNKDFNLKLGTYDPAPALKSKITKELKEMKKEKPEYTWVEREFNEDDIKYWNSYGVHKKQLKLFNVKAVAKIYINDNLTSISTKKNPIYAYVFPSGRVKFYRPLARIKAQKWAGNSTQEDINGYDQLPYFGDLLIITKSLKDVMCLHNLGYTAIAPQGEGQHLENNTQVQSLLPFFDKVVVFYDNDKAGRATAEKLGKALDISKTEIPTTVTGCKDVSDVYKKWKKKRTKKLLKTLIQNSQKE